MGKNLELYLELISKEADFASKDAGFTLVRDKKILEDYEKQHNCQLGVIHQSNYYKFVVDLMRTEDGNLFTYERLIPSVTKGAVVILPLLNDKFILLKQYRYTMHEEQYGFPRGFGERGIASAENVKKEILEELGANATQISRIGEVVANSGVSGEKVEVFSCKVDAINITKGYEGIQDIVTIDAKELKKWIHDGKINDGFTLAAFALWEFGKK